MADSLNPSPQGGPRRPVPTPPLVEQGVAGADPGKTVVAPLSAASGAGAHAHLKDDGGHGGPQRAKRSGRGPLIALIIIVVILGAAYAGGAYGFSRYFYPNTTVAGVDLSLVDADTAVERLSSQTDRYRLTVQGHGFSWEFTPEDASAVFDVESAVEAKLAANDSLLWPVHLIEHLSDTGADELKEVDPAAKIDRSLLSADFDEATFTEGLGQAVDAFNESRSGTFTATGAYDPEADAFSADRAREQEKLDRDNVIALALATLTEIESTAEIDSLGNDAFLPLEGGFTDDQLEAACDAANGLLGTDIAFMLGTVEAARLNSDTIAPWVVFDADLNPSIDQAQVDAWAQNLAGSMNTVGTTRTYTRPDGKQITVSGGAWGWIVDTSGVVSAAQNAIASKQTGTIDVPCSQTATAFNGAGGVDWTSYADVDLSEQYARYYDASGNLLWETPIISGNPNTGGATPEGVWYVTNKQRNIKLIAVDKDPETGKPEYESPVDYWIAFEGNLVGFHDASWQPASYYGNNQVYLWAGSHGCINTPYDKVAQLWDILQVGDCVIVHS